MKQKHKLSVLQVIPNLQAGGAEQTTIDVAMAIQDSGGRAVVASNGGRLVKTLTQNNIKHEKINAHKKNPVTIAVNVVRILSLIKKYDVNVVHARSRAPAWSALAAAKLSKIPIVTTYHGAYSQNNKLKNFYNSVMARADAVIANSKWTKNLILKRHGYAKGKITTIHRGTDMDKFDIQNVSRERKNKIMREWGVGEDDLVILNPGRLTEWKGQKDVVNAAEEVIKKYPKCRFILAGESKKNGTYKNQVQEMIENLKLQKYIKIVGHCEDMPAAIAVSDIVLSVANRPEAFGRVAVETQAMKKPIVVTNIGATKETVQNLKTGWKIKPNSPEEISNVISAIIRTKKNQKNIIANNARKFVKQNFSTKKMQNKTISLYKKIAKQ